MMIVAMILTLQIINVSAQEEQTAAQDPISTPGIATDVTPEPSNAVERAFEFYPLESGFGSFFDETVQAGASVTLKAMIANTGSVDQDLRTYAVDAHTADGGGFAAADYGSESNAVTRWIDYSEEVFTIDVGTGVERTFTVTVPENTPAGQYISAVAAEHAEALEIEGSANFRQIIRYVIPVFITVPGETSTSFEVGEVEVIYRNELYVFEVEILNTGDIRVRPSGEAKVFDAKGNLVASFEVALDSVYAHDQTILRVAVPASVGNGPFLLQMSLVDPETNISLTHETGELIADASGVDEALSPVVISDSSVMPGPDVTDVQFATVDANISNGGDPITNAQLSLVASLNGKEVERYPISQSLSLSTGATPINTRYIPATGWTSGEWTFELLLETVEPNGAAVVVARQQIEGSITIP
jgi:hypothetical protein